MLDCGGWDLGAATGRTEPPCDGYGDWGGWSEPQTVARDAMEGRIVVGSWVWPGGKVRGRIIVEPRHIPIDGEGDADDRVGVTTVDEALGLGQPESEMAKGLKHLSGRGPGAACGLDGWGQGSREVRDERSFVQGEGGVLWRGQQDMVRAVAQGADPGSRGSGGDGAALPTRGWAQALGGRAGGLGWGFCSR